VATGAIHIVEIFAGSDAHAGFTVARREGDLFASGAPADDCTGQSCAQIFPGVAGLLDGAQVNARKQQVKSGDGENYCEHGHQ
jgi:hypothetical protein